MATREVQYATGEKGYKAMVADFTGMFGWDKIDASATDTYTNFRKDCGDGTYVALRVLKNTDSYAPKVKALVYNGNSTFIDGHDSEACNMAYAFGNNFFAFCGTIRSYPMPYSGGSTFGGITTGRNILTGESSWGSFIMVDTSKSSALESCDYQLFSKYNKASEVTDGCINTDAKISAAIALHCPATGFVSDKIMMLSAIPDTYKACMAQVVFNGRRYVRLGHMLVPAE